jgi:hypothetical protein
VAAVEFQAKLTVAISVMQRADVASMYNAAHWLSPRRANEIYDGTGHPRSCNARSNPINIIHAPFGQQRRHSKIKAFVICLPHLESTSKLQLCARRFLSVYEDKILYFL